jgi:hypothetical protein
LAARRPQVRQILQRMSQEWQGHTYDLLARNCCHFCEVLAREMGTAQPVPGGWPGRAAAGPASGQAQPLLLPAPAVMLGAEGSARRQRPAAALSL